MKDKVIENIKKYKLLTSKSRVIVGVSGGADSVALLSVLSEIQKDIGFQLLAVHVNHNLRGEEALRDQNFVVSLCEKLGVLCEIRSVDVVSFAKQYKMTIEQAARVCRYNEFKMVAKEKNFSVLAVAHNANDQAETILMHLFRGAGIGGCIGMEFKVENIIRPLLNVTRDEIVAYLKEKNLNYVLDSTNEENKYTRNCIRNDILPRIENIYPSAKANICAFGERLLEIQKFINSKLNYDLISIKNAGEVRLSDEVKNLHDVEIKLLIKECFNRINNGVDIEEKHIKSVKQLLNSQVGKSLDLPHGIKVTKRRGYLEFSTEQLIQYKPFLFSEKSSIIETSVGFIECKVVDKANIGDGCLYFDRDQLPSDAVWRHIEKGDVFTKFSGGTKSVSRYLADKKYDVKSRKAMLVLASGNEVLAIPNVEISNKIKISKNTKKVVKICLKN